MDPAAIRELFGHHDLRWTKQREEVYAALAASMSHPTAEELFEMVHPRASLDAGGMSLATVYNTLEALVRCGLARRFPAAGAVGGGVGGGLNGWCHRYDADVSNHAHLLTADGHVRDVPTDLGNRVMDAIPADVVAEIERRMGVRIERLSVKFVEAAKDRVTR